MGEQIRDKIDFFYDNPEKIVEMGKNARKTALRYAWSIVREQYVQEYQKLL